MRYLFAALAIAGLAGPAVACINDTELPKYEREFRSQYRGTESPPATSAEPSSDYLLFGAGGTLLVGAAVVTVVGRRTRS